MCVFISHITAVLGIVYCHQMRYELATGYSLIQTQSLRGRPGAKKMVRLQIFILSEYRFPPPSSSENRDLCRVESDIFRENKCL